MIKYSKEKLKLLAKLTVTGILLFYVLRNANWGDIQKALSSAKLSWLFVTFLLMLCRIGVITLRWQLLLKGQNIFISYLRLLSVYFISLFLNTFIPGNLWGDIYRVKDSSAGGNLKKSSVTVLWDRGLGVFAQTCLAIIGIMMFRELPFIKPLRWAVPSMFLLVTFCLGLLYFLPAQIHRIIKKPAFSSSPVLKKVSAFVEEVTTAAQMNKQALILGFLLSLTGQLIIVTNHFCVLNALSITTVSFSYLLLAVPVATLLLLTPISFNGIGLTENIFFFFFSPVGISLEQSIAFSWLILIFARLSAAVIGGILFLLNKPTSCYEQPVLSK